MESIPEIFYVEMSKQRMRKNTWAGTVILDTATLKRVNILIHERPLLQRVFHDVEMF